MNKFQFYSLLIILCFSFASCKTATVVDIVNKDLQGFKKEESLGNPNFWRYQVDNMLIKPFFKTTGYGEKKGVYKYFLGLKVYKSIQNNSEIRINRVEVHIENKNKTSTFVSDRSQIAVFEEYNEKLEISNLLIFEDIPYKGIRLDTNAKVQVLIDVSSLNGNMRDNKKLMYDFTVDTRTYIVTR